jgi:hypothetical protein
MQQERDILREFVHPAIEEYAAKRNISVEFVDLRWGVETSEISDETEINRKILRVCLEEIDRCKPFIIVLLGERYGWIPPSESLDETLKEKGVDCVAMDCSVTALEIEYGALLNPEIHSFFYFRSPLPAEQMRPESLAVYIDSPENLEKLETLKSRIERERGKNVRQYDAAWDAARQKVVGLESFAQMVINDVCAALELAHTCAEADNTPFARRESAVYKFFCDKQKSAAPRTALVKGALKFVYRHAFDGGNILVLRGKTGCGKSTLFADIILRCAEDADSILLPYAGGLDTSSYHILHMLAFFTEILERSLGREFRPEEGSAENAVLRFNRLLAEAAAYKRVVIAIDALDEMENTALAQEMLWLSRQLPGTVRLLLSVTGGHMDKTLCERKAEYLEIDNPGSEEVRSMIDTQSAYYHKTLPPDVIGAIQEKPLLTPLYIGLIVQDLVMMDSRDFEAMDKSWSEGMRKDRIMVGYMLRQVQNSPETLDELHFQILKRLRYKVRDDFSLGVLGLLSFSQNGLREKDLAEIFSSFEFCRLKAEKGMDLTWSAVEFSMLRRILHKHFMQTGQGQWRLANQSLRQGVLSYLDIERPGFVGELSDALCGHLLSLDYDDPLYKSEALYQFWRGGRAGFAAGFIAACSDAAELFPLSVIYLKEGLMPNGERGFLLEMLHELDYDDEPDFCVTFSEQFQYILPETALLDDKLTLLDALDKRISSSFRPSDYKLLVASAAVLEQKGRAFLSSGKLDAAFEFTRQAANALKAMANEVPPAYEAAHQSKLSAVLDNVAAIATHSPTYKHLASKVIEESLEIRQNAQEIDKLVWNYEQLAADAISRKDFAKAQEYAKRAVPLRREAFEKEQTLENIAGLAQSHELLYEALLMQRQFQAAGSHLSEAYGLRENQYTLSQSGDTIRSVIKNKVMTGGHFRLAGDLEKARLLYEAARDMAKDLYEQTRSEIDLQNLRACLNKLSSLKKSR